MKDEDAPGVPSFRRLYLEISDLTEYRVASELLGGWDHWQALLASQWFQAYVVSLRDQLEVKLRSEAILNAVGIMLKGNNQSLAAAKWLAEGKYNGAVRGRPSKEQVAQEAKKMASINRRVQEDAERLGLTVISED